MKRDRRTESSAARSRVTERGVAMVAVMLITVAVTTTVVAYLTVARAEINGAKRHPARARAVADAMGALSEARLIIAQSAYASGENTILRTYDGRTIPGTEVDVRSMAGSGDDPEGLYFRLTATREVGGVKVRARQLLSERESLTNYFALTVNSNLGISGRVDTTYDPNNPSPLPPAALSNGRIHTNKEIEFFFPGWQHFLNPVSGGKSGGAWQHRSGSESGKQLFWFPEESRPDRRPVGGPSMSDFAEVRLQLMSNQQLVDFSESWAAGLVTRNPNGFLVTGDVDALVEFSNDAFTLTLRDRTTGAVAKKEMLKLEKNTGLIYIENGDPTTLSGPNQTVHLKGDLTGRVSVFAPTGSARIAGNVRYVDGDGDAAAIRDPLNNVYKPNPAYDGNATLGVIAEFDVRYGLKPTQTTWPETTKHVNPTTGQWETTAAPGLYGQPIGPQSNTPPVVDDLFGYLGGTSGDDDAEIHGSLLARRGRVYADGLNPLGYSGDAWAYRAAATAAGYLFPYARPNASLLRYGSTISGYRPAERLIMNGPSGPMTAAGWANGQSIYDEDLSLNAPPMFFRNDHPVFYEIEVTDGGVKR